MSSKIAFKSAARRIPALASCSFTMGMFLSKYAWPLRAHAPLGQQGDQVGDADVAAFRRRVAGG